MSPKLRGWLILSRGSNLPTVWSNVIAGWLLAQGLRLPPLGTDFWKQPPDSPAWGSLLLLLLGVSLTYVGGMILNDAFDAAVDARERPSRPIPSGRISRRSAFAAGFTLLAAAGLTTQIGGQAFINMGVNLGVLPTKGLTLPLMSYGGSAILLNLIAIAIVLRVDYENRQLMKGGRS